MGQSISHKCYGKEIFVIEPSFIRGFAGTTSIIHSRLTNNKAKSLFMLLLSTTSLSNNMKDMTSDG